MPTAPTPVRRIYRGTCVNDTFGGAQGDLSLYLRFDDTAISGALLMRGGLYGTAAIKSACIYEDRLLSFQTKAVDGSEIFWRALMPEASRNLQGSFLAKTPLGQASSGTWTCAFRTSHALRAPAGDLGLFTGECCEFGTGRRDALRIAIYTKRVRSQDRQCVEFSTSHPFVRVPACTAVVDNARGTVSFETETLAHARCTWIGVIDDDTISGEFFYKDTAPHLGRWTVTRTRLP